MRTFFAIAVTLAVIAVVLAVPYHGHKHGSETDVAEGEPHHGKHHHHKHHHHKHHHHHHWKCKGEAVNGNHELAKAKKECIAEFKENKANDVQDRQRGRACKSFCAGKKFGVFDEEGQIVQAKLNELIETMIESAEAQSEIKEKTITCAQNVTDVIKGGPNDVHCSNYKPYFKCLFLSTMEVCVKDFDAEDWE